MIISLKMMHQKSKHRYKESIYGIPYLFTFLNAFFGFLSILKSLDGDYNAAAYCIVLAAFMDMFDGKIARALGISSCLGMELDSLCDAISFCLAPAVLLYSAFVEQLDGIGIYILGIYVCAGLWRLAKFNVTALHQHTHFIGLPTTVAAFLVASIIIYEPWIIAHPSKILLYKYTLLMGVIIVAFLMVSHISFPSSKRSLSVPADYTKALGTLVFIIVCLARGYPILLLLVSTYIIGGIIKECFMRMQYWYK